MADEKAHLQHELDALFEASMGDEEAEERKEDNDVMTDCTCGRLP